MESGTRNPGRNCDRHHMNQIEQFTSIRQLPFRPVRPEDYHSVYAYTSEFGEGSCQYSPVSMYSLEEKYGDAIYIENDILYILRQHLCDQSYRVYLAPLGNGRAKIREGYLRIFSDAKACGKRVKFVSLTEKQAVLLEEEFPDRFEILEDRDLAEYMYKVEDMAVFSGSSLRKRRTEVNSFWRRYGTRVSCTRISPEDLTDILSYEQKWLCQNSETHDAAALEREARMIERQLSHFDQLHLSGVILRIDGTVRGFGYGTAVSDSCYDAIVEKADKSIPHIYKVLRQEATKQCALACFTVNMEEDLGVPGLRAIKQAYRPFYLLRKYIVTEKQI